MPAAVRDTPRSYLSADARRRHLLETAGRLVREGGWSALSMRGVAAAAGVSRQLVHEYFGTLEELSLGTLTHLFERAYASTEQLVRTGRSPEDTIRRAFALFLDMPSEERAALRWLAAEPDRSRRGLAPARARLRRRIAGIWVPFVRAQTGVGEGEATALAWMLTTASWGLADTVADGALGRDDAVALFVRFVGGTLSTWLDATRSRPTGQDSNR